MTCNIALFFKINNTTFTTYPQSCKWKMKKNWGYFIKKKWTKTEGTLFSWTFEGKKVLLLFSFLAPRPRNGFWTAKLKMLILRSKFFFYHCHSFWPLSFFLTTVILSSKLTLSRLRVDWLLLLNRFIYCIKTFYCS